MTFEPDGSDLLGEVGTLRSIDRDGHVYHEWPAVKLKWCEEAAAEAMYVPCRASAVASGATPTEGEATV